MIPRTDLKTAYKVTKRLYKKPENVHFVLLLLYSTAGSILQNMYYRIVYSEGGLQEEEISDYFSSLPSRPLDSVGREVYNQFPERQQSIIKASKNNGNWIEQDNPYSWLTRRYRDAHDIWHTLSGYKPDLVGEMCLAAFSYAQTKIFGWVLLAGAVFFHRGAKPSDIRLLVEAYIVGKRSKYLLAENYDTLLSENLTDARNRLNIRTPRYYQAFLRAIEK